MRLIPPLLLLACTAPPDPDVLPPNILVVISDDIGGDKTTGYGVAETFTPTLGELAERGMRFTNVYSNPSCSPSRATLMTGRLATRHGIGRWIYPYDSPWDLHLEEVTIPEMLAPAGYTSAAVGKWHMVRFRRSNATRHPLDQGFAHHRGPLANPGEALQNTSEPTHYFRWEKNRDGDLEWNTTYLTTDTVDEALALMEELPEPWFMWVAFNAAHRPWHVPPPHLNPMGVTADATDTELYHADALAFDMELGRLLDSMDPDKRDALTLIYLADNGTPGAVITEPYDPDRGKTTTYEGGVNVPLIVVGPEVATPGATSDALVHFSDLFPTVADLAGIDAHALTYTEGSREGESLHLDGQSFLPLLADPSLPGNRAFLFTESFYPPADYDKDFRQRTVRDRTHKLRRFVNRAGEATDWFYRLDGGEVDEGPALDVSALSAEDQAHYDALIAEMARMEADLTFDWVR